jgi:cytoskeletal protein RodZ
LPQKHWAAKGINAAFAPIDEIERYPAAANAQPDSPVVNLSNRRASMPNWSVCRCPTRRALSIAGAPTEAPPTGPTTESTEPRKRELSSMSSTDFHPTQLSAKPRPWLGCRRVSALIGVAAAVAMGALSVACSSPSTTAPTTTTTTTTTPSSTAASSGGGDSHGGHHDSGGGPGVVTNTETDTQTSTETDTATSVQTSTETDTATSVQTSTQTVTVTPSHGPGNDNSHNQNRQGGQ